MNADIMNLLRKWICIAAIICLFLPVAGCSGIAKGITEAVIGDPATKRDARMCYVRGRPFDGLNSILEKQGTLSSKEDGRHPVLKILMVHGIGTHQPGYSTRLAENLAKKLALTRFNEQIKEISLSEKAGSDRDFGSLRLIRYSNADARQEMIFAELTWDPIVEKEKASIGFDNSGEYSFRRASLNNSLKEFVNATIPDVLMYNGSARLPIQLSIGQALCWLMSETWDDMPDNGKFYCDGNGPRSLSRIKDDFVFITHSLGSRITVDMLQLIASAVTERAVSDISFAEKMKQLQEKDFTIFMLSNQLPLLQLGQTEPKVTGRIKEICGPGAFSPEKRMFKETRLIAFSDPNDLFSYAIPVKFLDEHLDSRLCPTLTNVVLNVAEVMNLLGGEFANPLSAHTEYDADARVLGLLTQGIGGKNSDPVVRDRCTWLEAVPTNIKQHVSK